ncbi:mitochondrial fission ELM1 family protein [Sneathiella sp.]|uniref:mitochondrial fission ELM1 family protein n=1 Tax=Sneathiella sp. TaxID=1964365 RepID=UPI0026277D12|nr:mitochondrial fission ELM1 family protein [Sneathiella sp.]MDF2367743.1 mitochondrial fission ELM1 family protein [Sneathiella sp.]
MNADSKLNWASCWVVTDGSAGMEIQCIGLAEALGLDFTVKRIKTTKPWRWLPPQLWINPLKSLDKRGEILTPPWPDVLISCGRQSIPLNLAIKEASGDKTFTIHIQTPNCDAGKFDLVIVPEHDKLRGGNVLVCLGALGRITPEKLQEAGEKFRGQVTHLAPPRVAVLVGGSNGCYDMTEEVMRDLVRKLEALHQDTGCSYLVTTSRRTGAGNEAILKSALKNVPHQIWTGDGENPYFGYLALADSLIVTGDSVNMVCEACSMGKPVHIFELPGGNAKFNHFHHIMRERGYTRPFTGNLESWSYPPLLETQKIAQNVRKILTKRFSAL